MAGYRGVAPNPAPPTRAKVRLRFAKRGRARFCSHRDVARVFERALRRAAIPVAHSHGFSPHPRLSWIGAAPTGVASEAEYVELGLTTEVVPDRLVGAMNDVLPAGLAVLDAVPVTPGEPALAARIDASRWLLELPGVPQAVLDEAVRALLAADTVIVSRMTKNGPRPVDVRAALVSAGSEDVPPRAHRAPVPDAAPCAILGAVVRQTTPAVRPDDVLGALEVVAGLRPPVSPMATRLAQGLLDDRGLVDPFDADRSQP